MKNAVFTRITLITFVAGYCDTSTFIAGGGVFSGNMPGNLIIGTAKLLNGNISDASIYALAILIFIIGCISANGLLDKLKKGHQVLLTAGTILIAAGLLAMSIEMPWATKVVLLLTTFSQGFQNAYIGRYSGENLGFSLSVNAIITQSVTGLYDLIYKKLNRDTTDSIQIKQKGILTVSFLTGCILGGSLSRYFGLISLLIPAVIIINSYFICSAQAHADCDQ